MTKPVQDVARPPLTQVLNTIPSPLTVTLIGLGPSIARLRHALEIVNWKRSWEEGWLALGCWWALCLFCDVALRYTLPVLLCISIVLVRRTRRRSEGSTPATEDTLHQAIADLSAVQSLLPHLPAAPFLEANVTLIVLIRTLAILYIPYLSLTYFVRLRVIVAIAGTTLLTWRARWALLIRRALWRSAYIRWGAYLAWSRISGQPLPSGATIPQLSALSATSPAQPQPINNVRFLFTVYENQRWWVGLDFTAALLPGERPSWSTSNQQPVNPPAAFTLPAPTTVYLPDPDRKGGRIKRTARWSWEEPEWKVSVRKEGVPAARVEKPLPSMQDDSAGMSASKLLKAAGKMRQSAIGEGSPERTRSGTDNESEGKGTDGDETAQEELYTDPDGWVYGGNKWEGGNAKSGIGKYTRYRRWTRVAVLSEVIERVDPGDLGIRFDDSPVASTHPLPPLNITNPHIEPPLTLSPMAEGAQGSIAGLADDDRSRLRQRLKAVVQAGTISSGQSE